MTSLTDRECSIIVALCAGMDWESSCDVAGVPGSYACRRRVRSTLLAKTRQPDLTAVRLWASPVTDKELQRLTGTVLKATAATA